MTKLIKCFPAQLLAMTLMWAIPFNLPAQSDSDESNEIVSRHRIDFSAIYFDSEGISNVNGLLGYAYNLTEKSNLAVDVSYLGSDSSGRSSGIGDTRVTYSFTPNMKLSVSPWVPQKVGSGISLVVPTGSTKNGRSLDAVLVNPFIGGVLAWTDAVFLAPLLSYTYSLDPIVTGKDVRLITAELGVVWTRQNAFWVGFYPTYIRDTVANKSHLNLNLSLGTMFSNVWGVSVTYSDLEQIEPGPIPEPKQIFDNRVELSIHYLF